MKTIDDYAEQANREIGRYYGHRLIFGHDLRPYIRCQDWLKEHWRRFPRTSPDGGKTIDNPPSGLLGVSTETPMPRIIEP